jgi:hypothetical protein
MPSANATAPVGDCPNTDAVSVTAWPKSDGFGPSVFRRRALAAHVFADFTNEIADFDNVDAAIEMH